MLPGQRDESEHETLKAIRDLLVEIRAHHVEINTARGRLSQSWTLRKVGDGIKAIERALLVLALLFLAPCVRADAGPIFSAMAWELVPQIADAASTDYCAAQSNSHASCSEGNIFLKNESRTTRDVTMLGLGVGLGFADFTLQKIGKGHRIGKMLPWTLRVVTWSLAASAVRRNLRNAATVKAVGR